MSPHSRNHAPRPRVCDLYEATCVECLIDSSGSVGACFSDNYFPANPERLKVAAAVDGVLCLIGAPVLLNQILPLSNGCANHGTNTPPPHSTSAPREDYFAEGRSDRIAGKPCRSANGGYLDGWYSVPNPPSPIYNKGKRHA